MIEAQSLIMAVLGLFVTMIGSFSGVLWYYIHKVENECDKNKEALTMHELLVATEYMPRKELDSIMKKLEDIQFSLKHLSDDFRDRLDLKQDKE